MSSTMRTMICHLQYSKCNFCFDWFQFGNTKVNVKICKGCFEKASQKSITVITQNDSRLYKMVPVPCLFEEQSTQKHKLNKLYYQQLDLLVSKWSQIEKTIDQKQINTHGFDRIHQFLEKMIKNHNPQQISQKIDFALNASEEDPDDAICLLTLLEIPSLKNTVSFPQKDVSTTKLSESDNSLSQIDLVNPKLQVSTQKELLKLRFKEESEDDSNKQNVDRSNVHFRKQLAMGSDDARNKRRLSSISMREGNGLSSRFNYRAKGVRISPYFAHLGKIKEKIMEKLMQSLETNPVLYRILVEKIYEAFTETSVANDCIELSSKPLEEVDILCYLQMFEWQSIQILKLVKVGLRDNQFSALLDFIADKKIHTLLVTNNQLTEESCQQLLRKAHTMSSLQTVYLGHNLIYSPKVKSVIKKIRESFTIHL